MNNTIGFLFFGLPVGILMIWSEIYNYKKQKNHNFIFKKDFDNIDYLNCIDVTVKLSNIDLFQIQQLIKRENYNSIEDIIEEYLNEII